MSALTTYDSATKEAAYQDWRVSGSLRTTARNRNLPEGTVISWCRADGWIARRAEDDEKDLAVIRAHALSRIVAEADTLAEDLLEIARSRALTKEDKIRLDAIKLSLAIIGIQPVQLVRQSVDVQTPAIAAPASYRVLSPEEQQAAGARLAGLAVVSDEAA